ncbi:diguanylate cyclase [Devosia psychrophila]|uniref:diguanylate cyclase n=1 Tax=Devosia psychrophila TaxID=728005 RepID=A0A1I1HEG2_9HYPH|nr:diguanylate cyclase [Devosia psychrophila]SFC22196.1 PAS domain S-box-containing protein/diguanylate cyclase (GGDEF) domain-containing protein [Devosia psychrophila]
MTSPWQILAGNLAVVALFILGWGHARFWLRRLPGVWRSLLFGVIMGLGAIASMLMAAEVLPGRFLDLRLSLVAVAAFFGGPVAALATTALTLGYRVSMGGVGMTTGVITILIVTASALAGRALVGRGRVFAWHGVVLGLAISLISAVGIYSIGSEGLLNTILPLGVLNTLATVLASLVFVQARRVSAERDLFAAALTQAPDFFYIKDRHSRFAAVNNAVAKMHGFATPHDMIGKTDFDIAPPERADVLFASEQKIIASGQPQLDIEELLPDATGELRSYMTAKVPLHGANGEMIGLAGVSRDITDDKQLRQDVIESRNLLSYALAEMSDGLAMFDWQGNIVLCNAQYSASFPYTSHARRQGVNLRDILAEVVRTREQLNIPVDHEQEWIDDIVTNLHRESEEEVHLFDDRWLQVRTRPTTAGKTLVVVTDVTRIKQAELALHSASDQLKHLARTDGLTGLLNRRAFDIAMDAEIARGARAGTPMSLLLIDVDRFKAYNDAYGHPSGDECLKLVASHLQKSLKRSADLAVRYGGEEFAAILPGTDEDGAYLVAETFRKSLADARVSHKGAERGILTASVGVATYMPDNLHRSAAELIQTADEALYSAKAAGRDRVYGTRVRAKQSKYAQE